MSEHADPYAFKPFPGSSHLWALEQVAQLPSAPLKVLDVGAAKGHVSGAIRAQRPDVSITAVEPFASRPDSWPEQDPWLTDLEHVPHDGFDLALALDVLEHVAKPEDFLKQIVSRCRPGATLLLSVPNVAHWSVRAQLACGRFEYTDRGILDRTHLRFFTRRSFGALVEALGLTILSSSQSIVPLELLLPQAVSESIGWKALRSGRRLAASALPGLLGFQLLVRVRT